ncbi:bifunctional acetate--CoA ligase family protein/GNAT family N-acetyltransferase, partial [Aduncisulcus paluster]
GTAECLAEYATKTGKTVLASWMGGKEVAEGKSLLERAGIPCFSYPDAACRVFNHLNRYRDIMRKLYIFEEKEGRPNVIPADGKREKAFEIIKPALDSERPILTEAESKDLLSLYDIPTNITRVAFTPEEAAKIATEVGFPVVVKIHSETITHKSDVGGVKIGLKDEAAVMAAFKDMETRIGRPGFLGVTVQDQVSFKDSHEVMLGMVRDPQYGPVCFNPFVYYTH